MRIAYTCQSYLPAKGGNQFHLKAFCEHFNALGHETAVFTSKVVKSEEFYVSNPENALPNEETIHGSSIYRYDINYVLYNFIYKFLIRLPGGYRLCKALWGDRFEIFHTGPLCPKMTKGIIQFNPDLILVMNSAGTHSYYSCLAKQKLKCPMVVVPCLHTAEDWVDRPIIYEIMREADRVIALTEYEKNYIAHRGVPEENIVVGGLGVDLALKENPRELIHFKEKYQLNDGPVIVAVGRLIEGKGMGTLIQAMPKVWQDIPTAKLVIAGSETKYKSVMEEMITQLDEAFYNNIVFIQNFDEKEKACIYQASDIFALPSNVDSFGTVFLEAWSYGKPVIACKDTPQATLIEDGEDGLLVPFKDAEQTAKAILSLCKNDTLRETLGTRGKLKVLEKYTWDKVIPWVDTIYQELVK